MTKAKVKTIEMTTDNDNGELTKRQREMLDLDVEIIAQHEWVKSGEQKLAEAKKVAKEAKEQFEGQIKKLRNLVNRLAAIQSGKPIQEELPLEPAEV